MKQKNGEKGGLRKVTQDILSLRRRQERQKKEREIVRGGGQKRGQKTEGE